MTGDVAEIGTDMLLDSEKEKSPAEAGL